MEGPWVGGKGAGKEADPKGGVRYAVKQGMEKGRGRYGVRGQESQR